MRIRRICSEDDDYDKESKILSQKLVDRGYPHHSVNEYITKVKGMQREETLVYKEKEKQHKIPFITTYNKHTPDIKNIIDTCWDTLKVNKNIVGKFTEKPILSFRRNMNLKDLIGQTKLINNKVVRNSTKQIGKCSPCLTRTINKCCKNIQSTSVFKNRLTNRIFKIFHHVNCKSKFIIYLVECKKCHDKPYVGKTELMANERLNGHRSDARKHNSIPVDRHFLENGHNFETDFKMTIIEQINKPNLTKESKRQLLLKREDFWIQKLQTLSPNGFNEELKFSE